MRTLSGRLLAAAVEALGGKMYGHTGSATTDCSRAVEAILAGIYGSRVTAEHKALMIFDPSQPFSPVEACERLGIGREVETPIPGCWHVVQGWRVLDSRGWVPDPSPSPNGHAFLFYQLPAPMAGSSILINANVTRPWLRRVTWGEACGPYRAGVRLCALIDPDQR